MMCIYFSAVIINAASDEHDSITVHSLLTSVVWVVQSKRSPVRTSGQGWGYVTGTVLIGLGVRVELIMVIYLGLGMSMRLPHGRKIYIRNIL